jgi:nitroreductase
MAIERHKIHEALNWRYAVKRFEASKRISVGDWQTLTESLRLTPSSYGMEPWRFVVIENPELRAELQAASWNQGQVTECSHFVVFLAKENVTEPDIDQYLQRVADARGTPLEKLAGFKSMLIKNLVKGLTSEQAFQWAQRQVYIALGFLLKTAALLKIDSTPMEGLDPLKYDEILGLAGSGWRTVLAVALGYRHADDPYQKQKKVRFTVDEIIQYK